MSNPFFSIILPTHNGEKRIGNTISSVLMQTFTDYELIIVCDACTDGTEALVRRNMDERIRIVTTNHKRDGLARNAGLDIATGQWILFIDDDDWYLHEYCLEQLSEIVGKHGEDVLDYAFVWRTLGYRVPLQNETFVMVWCRAWRRTFIGDNRFSDEPYGSDKRFFRKMIQDNPDVKVCYWNIPIYYYNYMREGSLSWMEKQHIYLDIVITHCDEPWDTCKRLFDSIAMQYHADMSKVDITLVQDGKETTLPWTDLLSSYPFKVNVLTIPCSGKAAARNVGLNHGTGDWVMFCDCDDFFADVCSLSMILENFPTDEYDIIWGKYLREFMWYKGSTYLNKSDEPNFFSTDNKFYRRQFLAEQNIRFSSAIPSHTEAIFNTIVLAETSPWRIVHLTTDFYMYVKRFRKGSMTHNLDYYLEYIRTIRDRELFIAEELNRRGYPYEFRKHIASAVAHEFHSVYNPAEGTRPAPYSDGFLDFYRKHRDSFMSVSDTDLDVAVADAETEAMNLTQSMFNELKLEYYFLNDNISFRDWLRQLDADAIKLHVHDEPQSTQNVDPIIVPADPAPADPVRQPRVVVYCGTYNVYSDMVASAKSLLINTPVDKIFFLIEDDTFPFDIPDIITTINVKNQHYFPVSGPNYDNAWTYMCMMRAAFPELFPAYDTILSLDVDVVVKSDISDLWNYDLSGYYLAGVEEPQRKQSTSDNTYINFGVTLFNLRKMRDDGIQQQVIDHLNTQKCGCPEQDAFNKICAGHILAIPNEYNVTAYSHITGDAQSERIVHYAGQKYWRHYTQVKQYADLDWNTIMTRQNELKEGADIAE